MKFDKHLLSFKNGVVIVREKDEWGIHKTL